MTPFDQTSVRAITIRRHTDRGPATTAYIARLRFRRSAEQGHALAQFNLGLMYHKGEGVPQDHTEAAWWYRRAAEQGHANAQFSLGLMYASGRGIPQDHAEAEKWWHRAAERGNASAQFNLGSMYEYGVRVAQDLVQAHKWYNLAASRASSSERERRQKAVRGRDRVASRLTSAELAKAQRLAGAWRPREPAVEQLEEEEHPSTSIAPVPEVDATDTIDIGVRIATLQRSLHRLGYDPGPVDGILGARTRAAIRAFQADAGLPVTGRISERLESAVLAAIVTAE